MEVRAGSGYRSQNSFVQILGGVGNAKQVDVVWPNGKKSAIPVEGGMDELQISYEE